MFQDGRFPLFILVSFFFLGSVSFFAGCTVDFGSNGSNEPDSGPPACGNGVLEAGEVCDGTDFGGQTCESAVGHIQGDLRCTESCRLDLSDCSTCGDEQVEGSERCDDGNTVAQDGCSASCDSEPGWVCVGEPSVCDFTCGNGQQDAGEECDDGNMADDDGCSGSCAKEQGWSCYGFPTNCESICGDGLIVGTELCDDGNGANGDGCSSVCAEEDGWECAGEPSECHTECGDSIIAGSEECDDGNGSGGDGCSSSCQVEQGWECHDTPSQCEPVCGDGLIRGTELCDDGNGANGDGCSSVCTEEEGWECVGEPSQCSTDCGDSILAASEECDDGNAQPGDGCSSSCQIEEGWECFGAPSVCQPMCGDGLIVGGEECDDGNGSGGDGCSWDCLIEQYFVCNGQPSECSCVVFVDVDPVTGPEDGTSWDRAFGSVQQGIDTAHQHAGPSGGCEVWVAEGTYYVYSSSSTDRVELADDVSVYGGFAGTEAARDQRDWQNRVTILDGRDSQSGSMNVRNVVWASHIQNARLDGFTVTGGEADMSYQGGGLHAEQATLEVANCVVDGNTVAGRGAGAWCQDVQATFTNTVFSNNIAMTHYSDSNSGDGGGILVEEGSVDFDRCFFFGNMVEDDGGGVDLWGGNHSLVNCVIHQNTADDNGGGLRMQNPGTVAVINTVIYANSGAVAQGVLCAGGCDMAMANSVVWGNGQEVVFYNATGWVRYSNVQGGEAGTGNIDSAPGFVDAAGGDFHLSAGSPCIDAADGDLAPEHGFDGNSRVDDSSTPNQGTGSPDYADMGAYEYQP